MKTIYLIRHAHSSRDNYYMLEDHERPLDDKGKTDASAMARQLKKLDIHPEFALCSTAKRTKETFSYFTEHFPGIPLSLTKKLYLAPLSVIEEEIKGISNDYAKIFLIGHNHGVSDLVSTVLKRHVELDTCSFTQIEFPVDDWKDIDLANSFVKLAFSPKDIKE